MVESRKRLPVQTRSRPYKQEGHSETPAKGKDKPSAEMQARNTKCFNCNNKKGHFASSVLNLRKAHIELPFRKMKQLSQKIRLKLNQRRLLNGLQF